jgi:uncharacterized membrane protein YfcA
MTELAAILVGVFLGAIVSGFSGFAFSAVAGAVLIHVVEPHKTIPLMMGCSIVAQILTMITLRRSVRFAFSPILLASGLFGVGLAVTLVAYFNGQTLRWLFGAFLAAYSTYLLIRTPTSRVSLAGPYSQGLVGTLGGAVGVLTAMPGAVPSIWCELRGYTKEQQRGTVQPFIIGMQVFALILFAQSPIGLPDTLLSDLLIALPPLFLGIWIGALAFQKVDGQVFRKSILLLLLISGLAMLR